MRKLKTLSGTRMSIAMALLTLVLLAVAVSGASAVPPPPTVTGTVTDAVSTDPIEAATVTLQTGPLWTNGTFWPTLATGQYSLYDTVDGSITYRVRAFKTGYTLGYSGEFLGLPTTPPQDIALTPDRSVYGRVTATVGDNYWWPMAELYRVDSGVYELVESKQVDTVRDYAFTSGLATGEYRVRAIRPGDVTKWSSPIAHTLGNDDQQDLTLDVDPEPVARKASNDRYTTAVSIAREAFTLPEDSAVWPSVSDIVIASGEDRAAADPLAAAGLCGVYRAPLFLVGSKSVSVEVKQAIKDIVASNGTATLRVVGGPVSVPDARIAEIKSYVASVGTLNDERLLDVGDRFDMSAAIAERMWSVEGGDPEYALVANGADPSKFFDALALSPISAYRKYPVLLVRADSIPAATENAIAALGQPEIIVGGGPSTVSEDVLDELSLLSGSTSERWDGADRYKTAIRIAEESEANYWTRPDTVGVAAKLPDALTGGSMIGLRRGSLLITNGEVLTQSTGDFLESRKATIDKCYVFGGEKSMTPGVKSAIEQKLQ